MVFIKLTPEEPQPVLKKGKRQGVEGNRDQFHAFQARGLRDLVQ